jgi:hypothetical protein
MKNICFMVAMAIITIAPLGAQKVSSDKIPATVINAFKAKFPGATKIKWEIAEAKDYEAEFKLDGVEYSANFAQDGTWLETETEMEVSQLPQAVSQAITKDFAGFKIEEAEKTETSDHKTYYEVEISKDKETLEVQISTTGAIMNRMEKKEDND